MADNTKYSFNNKTNLGKRNLAFEVISKYLNDNSSNSYQALKSIFNFKASNGQDVIYDESDYLNWSKNLDKNSSSKRYKKYTLPSNNNFYISTQWSIDSIQPLIKLAKNTFNYNIEIVISTKNNIILESKQNQLGYIKNIILYGAPGVGKTHNYQRLISMLEDGKGQNEIFEAISKNDITEQDSDEVNKYKTVKDEKRVEFVTFHQSYSYEDFIEGFRPNEKGGIELDDGIFKSISKKAIENTNKSVVTDKLVFSDALDILLKDKLQNEETVKINLKRDNSFFEIYDYDNKTIYYTRQGRSKDEKYHTLAVSTLNRMYDDEENNFLTGGLKTYYLPLLNFLLKIGKEKKVEQVEQKNHYIVIDEINRGNISKIFGELITLIEEDKRDNYEVTLPYSKQPFKVPSNLYIIATMNSTDKSIATIDIALRRRFTFLKMQPNESLVDKYQKAQDLMRNLNEFISNKEKGNLGDDYKLGHSYFMKVQNDDDLEFVKKYKILPLLEEYFYADDKNFEEATKILNLKEQL